jgi:hypothetical protein
MARVHPIVFLVDVDNTLLDNDGVRQDLKDHLERAYGRDARDRYWSILEDLFSELGYRDYLGALQRFRAEHPREVELLSMSGGDCEKVLAAFAKAGIDIDALAKRLQD